MKTTEKTRFRNLLLTQREELRMLSSFDAETNRTSDGVLDFADQAAGAAENAVAEEVGATESRLLDNIDLALERLDDGTYGMCEDCDEKIPLARLRAKPAATRCLTCQIEKERGESAQRRPRRVVSAFE